MNQALSLENKTEFLSTNILFKALSKEEISEFAGKSVIIEAEKGQVLCCQGDEADYFYIIHSGWVKLYRMAAVGEEAIIDILNTTQIFGEAALSEGGVYSWNAETVEDSVLLRIPIQILKDGIHNNKQMALNIINSMSLYRDMKYEEVEHLKIQNAPQRLGCLLLSLTPHDCRDGSKPCPPIQLPYDKSLLALRLGMKPETLSRALKTLKDKTGVETSGSDIQIKDMNALRDYTCDFCSKSFPCEN